MADWGLPRWSVSLAEFLVISNVDGRLRRLCPN